MPGDPEELTSTIVLTSKDSHYVDIRLFRDKWEAEQSQDVNSETCIEWAFAGKAHAEPKGARKGGMIQLSHTTWDHWIDSKGDNPGPDEGDMWVQRSGDVLERGKQRDAVTGAETEYEELWHDLEVTPLGTKNNRSSVVLKADGPDSGTRGLTVKVGGWCQGILKVNGVLTIERWQRVSESYDSGPKIETGDTRKRTRNDWIRTFRVGTAVLPCEYVCSSTSGKLGLNTTLRNEIDNNPENLVDWKIIEEYYW